MRRNSTSSAGLTLEQVVEAVNDGSARGSGGPRVRPPHPGDRPADRHAARREEPRDRRARGALPQRRGGRLRHRRCRGGLPADRHLDAFEYLRAENAHFTIHAGEAFGLTSIWEAIQWCGADRLGHGVRIVDDITVEGLPFPAWLKRAAARGLTTLADVDLDSVYLGLLAAYVRDARIPLEMCPSSNIQTGAAASVGLHPISLLARLRFRVTLNTDNRLMSGTSLSREAELLAAEAEWTLGDLRWVTINAMKSAFLPFDQRLALIDEVIKPGYAATGLPV
jgi:adenosine deaminase